MLLIPCLVVGYTQDLQNSSLTGEVADRLAIKDIIDAYAHYADRREAENQSELFTADGEIGVFQGEPGKNKSTAIIKGRKDLIAGFKTLKNMMSRCILMGKVLFNFMEAPLKEKLIAWHITYG